MTGRGYKALGFLSLLLIAVSAAAIYAGFREGIDNALQQHIFISLQLPVVFTAILVGAALATSAGTLQVVLRNPLADPGIIGITSGASLVAAVLLLLLPDAGLSYFQYLLPMACFVGALCSTLIIYRLARRLSGMSVSVILAGIAVSTVAGALVAWFYLFADAQSMRNLTFWLMGSLYQTDWVILWVCGPIILISLTYQCYLAKQLNWLYAGEIQAAAAGVNPKQLVNRSLISAAVAVGAAVSMAGSIAFVGLLVPHFLRLMLGHDNRLILPASALLGAIILLLVVLLTEGWHQITLPVSMITATVGGPLMIFALYRGRWQ